MDLKGKRAIVTGASRGIGAAIARRLGQAGAQVAILYRTDDSAAHALVEELKGGGGRAFCLKVDVSQLGALRGALEKATEELTGLDMLVNNAGVVEAQMLCDVSEDAFDRQVAVNFKAVVFACRFAGKHLGEGGAILNVSSLNARRPTAGASIYSATKAAVEAFTVALAHELGPGGIRVNAIAPGTTDTDMLQGANSEDALQGAASLTPLGRLGTVEDIADAACFFLSDQARWITGETLAVSGGLLA